MAAVDRDPRLYPAADSRVGGPGARDSASLGIQPRPAGERVLSRRTVLQAGAVLGAATTVAGCAVGASDPEPPAAPLTNAVGKQIVIAVDRIPSGGATLVTIDRRPVILARSADGEVVAHSAVCTHQRCTVQPDGANLLCPCHGSRFDAFTGGVLRGPAELPLEPVDIAVDEGNVVAG